MCINSSLTNPLIIKLYHNFQSQHYSICAISIDLYVIICIFKCLIFYVSMPLHVILITALWLPRDGTRDFISNAELWTVTRIWYPDAHWYNPIVRLGNCNRPFKVPPSGSWYSFSFVSVRLISLTLTHNGDVMMGAMASRITVSIVCTIVCSGADERKHQSFARLAFVRGIHRWPVNSPHKKPETRKMFPFDDVIMLKKMGISPAHGIGTRFPVWHSQRSRR